MKRELTPERLREVVAYDPETGVFRWKVKPNRRICVGDVIGTNMRGYLKTSIDGIDYSLHRLAWLYVYGEWPKSVIDHINGKRADNRIANLRDVPVRVNQENQSRATEGSRSGRLGVTPVGGKWLARIHVRGKNVRLGLFDSPDVAHATYVEAKRQLHEGNTL